MKENLIRSIREKEIQLAKLKPHVEKSRICGDLYNKIVLEKAILKKEFEKLNENKIVNGIKNIIPRRKKLICDYFK